MQHLTGMTFYAAGFTAIDFRIKFFGCRDCNFTRSKLTERNPVNTQRHFIASFCMYFMLAIALLVHINIIILHGTGFLGSKLVRMGM